MKAQSEEIAVAQDAPATPAKLSLVVILAMLLGVLLTLIAAGAWLHSQQRAAWVAEVQALDEALKVKELALDELQAQNALLAKHIKVLKGYSVASSTAASEKTAKVEDAPGVTGRADNELKATAKTPVQSPAKKTKAEPRDCELAGKTPEQQAAMLQRCVSQIDSPSAKPRQ